MIESTLTDLKRQGRLSAEPTFAATAVDQWEKTLSVKFPAAYRSIVTGGSYEIANFYFVAPEKNGDSDDYIIFSRWTEDDFAFRAEELRSGEAAVYVLVPGTKPLRRYENFSAWFAEICEMAARPINPE